MVPASEKKPKHTEVSDYLRGAIANGRYGEGDRLPSENQLVEQFGASRPTVARALRDLQNAGLIERRVGSGSYVRAREVAGTARKRFGLLIPQLGQTEIFEPICGQIARQIQELGHVLLWGDFGDASEDVDVVTGQARQACHGYVEQDVAGVFFAPIEHAADAAEANSQILGELAAAAIPVVLLDRDAEPFPQRSPYDLVGIDNLRGGYLLARHLLQLGRRRICFVARPRSAPTVAGRVAGYREALWDAGVPVDPSWVRFGDAQDASFVRKLLKDARPDAMICANDITAANLLQTLADLNVDVPGDVGVVGFNDVKYARLLRVPLTTIAQPCRDLGTVAVAALIERLARPDLPPRTLLLEPTLVVRKSCGAVEAQGAPDTVALGGGREVACQ